MSDKILVTVEDKSAFIKVVGKGNFSVAPELKKFCFDQIARGVCQIIIDMSECVTMDSTFMGVMAGIAMRLRDLSDYSFLVINLSPKTKDLLEVLGLTNLIDCYLTDELKDDEVENFEADKELNIEKNKNVTANVMLKAHQDLIKADKNNKLKFESVVNYLAKEVDKT